MRIICWDFKNKNYPIIAAIEEDGEELLYSYTNKGYYKCAENNSRYDLFILEESTYRPYVKREEFLCDMKEHGPMLFSANNDCYYTVSRLDVDKIFLQDTCYNYDLLKKLYTWQDGHPCGIAE